MTDKTLTEVEQGLNDAASLLPEVAPFLSLIPGLGPWASVAIAAVSFFSGAVQTVQQASGQSLPAAVTEVLNHLTPGKPNSPNLSPTSDNRLGMGMK